MPLALRRGLGWTFAPGDKVMQIENDPHRRLAQRSFLLRQGRGVLNNL